MDALPYDAFLTIFNGDKRDKDVMLCKLNHSYAFLTHGISGISNPDLNCTHMKLH